MTSPSSERGYPLTYRVTSHPDKPVSKQYVIDNDLGACDALGLLSIVYPPDGSISLSVASVDGRTGKNIADSELFKCWVMMAHLLSESDISPAKRELCEFTFDAVMSALDDVREEIGDG